MFECRLLILNAHSVRCAHVADSLARLRCATPSADLTPVPFPKGKGSKVKESRSACTALSHVADSLARLASLTWCSLRLVLTFFLPCDRLAVTRERGDLLAFHSNAHALRDFQDHHLVIQFRDSADQPAGCHHLVVALEGFEHLLMRAGFLGLGTNHKEIDDADNQHHRYSRKRDYLVKHSLRASAARIRLRPRDSFKPHLFSTRSKPLRRRLAGC